MTLYHTSVGMRTVTGLGHENEGGGVAICDINANGKPDMILMGVDNPVGENSFWYKVLFDIDENGFCSNESKVYCIQANGWDSAGGGIALSDINKNGKPDMILLCADDPGNNIPANFCYKIAYDIKADGSYTSVSSTKTIDAMGCYYDGADIDVSDINGNGVPDLLIMVYDNPKGGNSFRYKIAFDLNAGGNYQSLSPAYEVEGVGDSGEGAGVAIGDIDKNGTLDLLFMALDAPSESKNTFRYRILPNLDKYGTSYSPLSDPICFPTSFSPCEIGAGAGCCMYDIDNNGVLDVVFMGIDFREGQANAWKYIVGSNLNKQGIPMQWR